MLGRDSQARPTSATSAAQRPGVARPCRCDRGRGPTAIAALAGQTEGTTAAALAAGVVQLDPAAEDKRRARVALPRLSLWPVLRGSDGSSGMDREIPRGRAGGDLREDRVGPADGTG